MVRLPTKYNPVPVIRFSIVINANDRKIGQ